jgi:nucleoside-diphosphate-sugar epimerase
MSLPVLVSAMQPAFQVSLALPLRNATSVPAVTSRRLRMSAAAETGRKVLVINTKGGGHAVIGPHLAESLLAAGNAVHLLQVGPESTKGPFARYAALADKHPDRFSLAYGDVSEESVPVDAFNAVYDNNAKSVDDVEAVIRAGKAGAEVFYVSSAGAYACNPALAPHLVGDSAKGPTIDVENALRANGVSSACFRPIYIIGPGSAKREYTDFFFDRIVRDRPLPIPGTGAEFTSITVRSLSKKLSTAVV